MPKEAPPINAQREALEAARGARSVLAAFAVAVIAAVGMNSVTQAISVPSLPSGVLRQKIVVPLVEDPSATKKSKETLVEHTVAKSDFQIEKKISQPIVESKSKSEIAPEPKLEPKPKPKPVNKPKVRPKPASKPAPKPEPVVEPQAPAPEIRGQAEEGASGGMGGSGTHHSASSDAARQSALALIVDTIDANKSYPRRARQNGIEGVVLLRVTIDSDGRISTVDVKKKHASVLLNRAALKAANKLIGMRLEGVGPLEVDVPVAFDLKN